MRSIFKMPSDDMPPNVCEGAQHYDRRKANAKHFQNAFRRYAAERM